MSETKNPPTTTPRGHRRLWIPKYPEVKKACASCPFATDNDAEFSVVVNRLREIDGKWPVGVDAVEQLEEVRRRLRVEVNLIGGDFLCHLTAYDDDMELTEQESWRQCAGASQYYRTGERS